MKQSSPVRRVLPMLLAATVLCLLLVFQKQAVFDALSSLILCDMRILLAVPAAQTAVAPEADALEDEEESSDAPTKPQESAETAAPKTTVAPEPTDALKPSADLTATPDDIRALTKQAKKETAGQKAGAIRTQTFTTEGVTDTVGNVRIKNINRTKIDAAALLRKKAALSVDGSAPAVLIFHTYTTESYQYLDRGYYTAGFPTRDNDSGRNMVRVGDEICAELERMGFAVLHDTEIHDARYTGAYERSRAAVQRYQKQYPSLQVLLDIHRDAIQQKDGVKIKPTATVNGKKAAQVMIISGCQESGNGVTDFPNWQQNLVFALQLQEKLETAFPGLTRPLFFAPRRYNMHLSPCSLLLEVGSDSNTLEEAAYSGRLIGHALALLLADYTKEDA